MKVAFIHDWLIGMRGGEKVLEAACEMYPESEIYTLLYNPRRVSEQINYRKVHASWLQSLPFVYRYYRGLLPLMTRAIRSFDLQPYDLVLSFSHCVAKGIRVSHPDAESSLPRRPIHICYCFTPMRYIYSQFENYFPNGSHPWIKRAAQWLRPYLIHWDRKTTEGVDFFIACSQNVRRRIQQTYGRDSHVIYPPVDTDFYTMPRDSDLPPLKSYYLAVGALVPYKRVDLAIEACRRLNVPLKIVGVGTEENRLKKMAEGAAVEFLGWQSQQALKRLYQNCEALLFPQEEDFGIAAVEAMACGRPVIAYQAGGALETVREVETGIFFKEQTVESMAQAIKIASHMRFNPAAIRAHARRFDREIFKKELSSFVARTMENGTLSTVGLPRHSRHDRPLERSG